MKKLLNKVKKSGLKFGLSPRLMRLILWAFLLRLLLIPFFAHPDILKTYRRAYNVAFNNTSLFNYLLSIVPHGIQALTLKLADLVAARPILNQINFAAADITHINLLLFIMKLPYLLAEVLFWLVLAKFFKLSKTAWNWLLFNPVIIYSVYMFGRYESFVLLFLALFIVGFKKVSPGNWQDSQGELCMKGAVMGLFWLILLIFTRFSLVLLLPGLIFLPWKQSFKNLRWVLLTGLLTSLLILTANLLTNWQLDLNLVSRFSGVLQGQHASYFNQAQISLGFGAAISLFWLVLAGLLLLGQRAFLSKLPFIDKFNLFSMIILSSYFASAIFHPQYFTWLILPLTLLLDKFVWRADSANSKDGQDDTNNKLDISKRVEKKFYRSIQLQKTVWVALGAVLLGFTLWIFFWNTETTLGLLFPVFPAFKFAYFPSAWDQALSQAGRGILFSSLIYLNWVLIKEVNSEIE